MKIQSQMKKAFTTIYLDYVHSMRSLVYELKIPFNWLRITKRPVYLLFIQCTSFHPISRQTKYGPGRHTRENGNEFLSSTW